MVRPDRRVRPGRTARRRPCRPGPAEGGQQGGGRLEEGVGPDEGAGPADGPVGREAHRAPGRVVAPGVGGVRVPARRVGESAGVDRCEPSAVTQRDRTAARRARGARGVRGGLVGRGAEDCSGGRCGRGGGKDRSARDRRGRPFPIHLDTANQRCSQLSAGQQSLTMRRSCPSRVRKSAAASRIRRGSLDEDRPDLPLDPGARPLCGRPPGVPVHARAERTRLERK